MHAEARLLQLYNIPSRNRYEGYFSLDAVRAAPKLGLRTMGVQMIRLFSSAMLLTISVAGNAFATPVVGVPSPEIGGGMVGTMVAAGVVYLISRRRSRS